MGKQRCGICSKRNCSDTRNPPETIILKSVKYSKIKDENKNFQFIIGKKTKYSNSIEIIERIPLQIEKIKTLNFISHQHVTTSSSIILPPTTQDTTHHHCLGIPFEKVSHLAKNDSKLYLPSNPNTPIAEVFKVNNLLICKSINCSNSHTSKSSKHRCESCQKLWRNSLRKVTPPSQRIIQLTKKIESLQAELQSIKSKLDYRTTKFEEILEASSEDQKYYLVSLLYQGIKHNKIHEDQFFYKLMQNTFENVIHKKTNNGFRYNQSIIQFCAVLYYYCGTTAYEIFRGYNSNPTEAALDHYNIPLPSIQTIRKYLPEITYGTISDKFLKQIIIGMKESKVACEMVLSWDEFEIKSGLIYNKQKQQIIGFVNENTKSIRDAYQESLDHSLNIDTIARKVIQFCLTSIDGMIAFPCAFYGHGGDHIQLLKSKCKDIKNSLEKCSIDDYKLNIIAASSDGATGNDTFVETQTIFDGLILLYDFSHLVKRLRNVLLNHNLWYNGVFISIDLLAKLRHLDSNGEQFFFHYITEELINPTDKMAMKPVLELIDPIFTERLISFSIIENSTIPKEQVQQFVTQIQTLGKYLQQCYHIYNVFIQSTNNYSISDKSIQIKQTIQFFKNWHKQVELEKITLSNFLPDKLHIHIINTLLNLETLLQKYPKIRTSSCSTLFVENLFSCIRGKVRFPSMKDYAVVMRLASFCLECRMASDCPFTIRPKDRGQCYGDANISIKLSPLVHQTTSLEEPALDLDETISIAAQEYALELCDEFGPVGGSLLLREYLTKYFPTLDGNKIRNRISLYCPIEGCTHKIGYNYYRAFIKHLMFDHNLNPVQSEASFATALSNALNNIICVDSGEAKDMVEKYTYMVMKKYNTFKLKRGDLINNGFVDIESIVNDNNICRMNEEQTVSTPTSEKICFSMSISPPQQILTECNGMEDDSSIIELLNTQEETSITSQSISTQEIHILKDSQLTTSQDDEIDESEEAIMAFELEKRKVTLQKDTVVSYTKGKEDSTFSHAKRIIIYDLETTGFITKSKFPEIIEISMIDLNNNEFKHMLIMPSIAIDQGAQNIHGLTIQELEKNNAISQENAWLQILQFIKPKSNDEQTILVAHNGRRFDHKIMEFYLQQVCTQQKDTYPNIITVDSLDIFKQYKDLMPVGTKTPTGRQRHILGEEHVYLHLFGVKPEFSHEALYDTIYLLKILLYLSSTKQQLFEIITTTKSVPLFPVQTTELQNTTSLKKRKEYCCRDCRKPLKGNDHSTCNKEKQNASQPNEKTRKSSTLDNFIQRKEPNGGKDMSNKRRRTI